MSSNDNADAANNANNGDATSSSSVTPQGNGSSTQLELAFLRQAFLELQATFQKPRALDKHFDMARATIPKFDGTVGEDCLTWDDWLQIFVSVGENYSWEEADYLAMLPTVLRGRAQKVFCQIPLGQRRDWDVVKAKFDVSFARKQTPEMEMYLLIRFSQGGSQSVAEYTTKHSRLVFNAFPDHDASDPCHMRWQTGVYINGLKNGLRTRVWEKTPATFDDAVRLALQFESLHELTLAGKADAERSDKSPKKGNNSWRNPKSHGFGSGQTMPSEQTDMGQGKTASAAEDHESYCIQCQKPGHKANSASCPKAARIPSASAGGCFNCGSKSHLKRDCTEPPSNGGQQLNILQQQQAKHRRDESHLTEVQREANRCCRMLGQTPAYYGLQQVDSPQYVGLLVEEGRPDSRQSGGSQRFNGFTAQGKNGGKFAADGAASNAQESRRRQCKSPGGKRESTPPGPRQPIQRSPAKGQVCAAYAVDPPKPKSFCGETANRCGVSKMPKMVCVSTQTETEKDPQLGDGLVAKGGLRKSNSLQGKGVETATARGAPVSTFSGKASQATENETKRKRRQRKRRNYRRNRAEKRAASTMAESGDEIASETDASEWSTDSDGTASSDGEAEWQPVLNRRQKKALQGKPSLPNVKRQAKTSKSLG